jgi:hypothetical protein
MTKLRQHVYAKKLIALKEFQCYLYKNFDKNYTYRISFSCLYEMYAAFVSSVVIHNTSEDALQTSPCISKNKFSKEFIDIWSRDFDTDLMLVIDYANRRYFRFYAHALPEHIREEQYEQNKEVFGLYSFSAKPIPRINETVRALFLGISCRLAGSVYNIDSHGLTFCNLKLEFINKED